MLDLMGELHPAGGEITGKSLSVLECGGHDTALFNRESNETPDALTATCRAEVNEGGRAQRAQRFHGQQTMILPLRIALQWGEGRGEVLVKILSPVTRHLSC